MSTKPTPAHLLASKPVAVSRRAGGIVTLDSLAAGISFFPPPGTITAIAIHHHHHHSVAWVSLLNKLPRGTTFCKYKSIRRMAE